MTIKINLQGMDEMDDFIICSRCEALLIIDEFESHECTPNHRFERRSSIS